MKRRPEGTRELKLKIELVPSTSWYNNLRNKMDKRDWEQLRKKTYGSYGHQCGICDTREGRLNCHEIWEYDDKEHIQKLIGFIALCGLCHHVKHIGLAGILAEKGQLDYDKVIEHFMKVNGCDRHTFLAHKRQAFAQWRERSQHDWQVDLGEYRDMIDRK